VSIGKNRRSTEVPASPPAYERVTFALVLQGTLRTARDWKNVGFRSAAIVVDSDSESNECFAAV
jgi:hypothetical protein